MERYFNPDLPYRIVRINKLANEFYKIMQPAEYRAFGNRLWLSKRYYPVQERIPRSPRVYTTKYFYTFLAATEFIKAETVKLAQPHTEVIVWDSLKLIFPNKLW